VGSSTPSSGTRTSDPELAQEPVEVLGGLHLALDRLDGAVGSDDDGAALHAPVRAAVVLLLDPEPERVGERVLVVDEQVERQVVLGAELLVALDAVLADAVDDEVLDGFELAPRVAQRAGLRRAAGRVVLGV